MSLVLILILSAALLAVWWHRDRIPAGRPAVLLLALILAGLSLLRLFNFESSSRYTGTYEIAAGYMLAGLVAEAVPDGGTVLLVQYQSDLPHLQAVAKAQQSGVSRRLKGLPWQVVSVGPPFVFDPGNGFDTATGLNSRDFESWLLAVPDADAVISFLGIPSTPPTEKMPPMAALLPGPAVDLPSWPTLPLLGAAALKPGINPLAKTPKEASPADAFKSRYEWVE